MLLAAAIALASAACGHGRGGPDGGSDAGSPDGGSTDGGNPDAGPACAVDAPTSASAQTRARLGAYYFDGWTASLDNFHFQGLLDGGFSDRQPLTGWQDADPCVVEKQLATARAFGIDFFVFDWYFGAPGTANGERLNNALEVTHALPDRHGMQYAILYVNADPFVIAPADWPAAVTGWISYFKDPAYLRIGGKPALFVIDSNGLRDTFGSSAAVRAALDSLRSQAQAAGLPGVYVVGGLQAPRIDQRAALASAVISAYQAEGYDAVTLYNYPGTPLPAPGGLPFSALADAGRWIWDGEATYGSLAFIPVAAAGWDPRPWNELDPSLGYVVYYSRTPAQVAALTSDAIDWAEGHPRLRTEPAPAPPLVLLEAWNEVGEGSYLLPTVGEGRAYGDALAAALTPGPSKARTALTVDENGPAASAARQATGTLKDASGAAIASATVALTAVPVDGNGLYAQYALSDHVPANATRAVVGFRVNYELLAGDTPGASDLSLYRASFQLGDGVERVANGDFSSGATSWTLGYQAQLAASDRGAGQMVQVQATAAQQAGLTSAPFAVSAGSAFTLSLFARVSPASASTGYFAVIFLDDASEVMRLFVPLGAGRAPLGTAVTDASGAYALSIASLGAQKIRLSADYAGDGSHFPAWASVAR
jgi:hypothetical protein